MLSEKLKQLRNESGLTQEQVAEKLNCTRSAIARWETDKGIPDITNLIAISELYNVTIDELIKDNEKVEQKVKADSKAKKWHLLVIIYLIAIVTYIAYFVIVHRIFMVGFLVATLFMLGIEFWVFIRKRA